MATAILSASPGHPVLMQLCDAVEAFLLSRRAAGCTERTLQLYGEVLGPFVAAVGPDLSGWTPTTVQAYLGHLRIRLRPTTVSLHASKLRAFFRWCVEFGLLQADPIRGLRIKVPKKLPRVPDKSMVTKLLLACRDTFEEVRNRAAVSLMADGGARNSEVRHLGVSDVDLASGTLVNQGKGQQDGFGFFGERTAEYLRDWLALRPGGRPDDPLFVDRKGRPLTRRNLLKILHTLSKRAGLPWRVSPHDLRRFAATQLLLQTGDVHLVQRVLRHGSISTTLVYLGLSVADVQAKFRLASPIDNLGEER